MEKLYLDATDIQKVTGLSRSTVYSMLHAAGFPSIRIGRRLLVRLDALNQWMDAQSNTEVDRR